ncbi:DUF4226 domain-containing protein [Nocardia mangyaensis]|uniref:DUF4226 domain-containing protein n=1 Tax=Nocardia mangyaensis TaxID=2213200 RepID=UPI0026744931|nr:DUF4226 domain-containing protein [Nocardia mangyaensis]MDO3648245.1 DUF4226 domain-containing protein [Nocardia mangyaensis]
MTDVEVAGADGGAADPSILGGFGEDGGAGQVVVTPWTSRRQPTMTTAPGPATSAPGPATTPSGAAPAATTTSPAAQVTNSLPPASATPPGAIVPVAATTTSPEPMPGPDQMPVIGTTIPENLGSPHRRTTPEPDPDTTTDSGSGIENVLAHMLPTLTQALSGLTAPTSTSPNTPTTHTSPGTNPTTTTTGTGLSTTTVTDTTDAPVTIGLTPQADHALKILKVLAALYGAREKTTTTPTTALDPVTATTGGTSTTTTAHTRTTLFQQHAATAFTNLDNRLANYITNLAGTNTVHRTRILALIRETNVALAALGPDTYTPTGQRRAHNILTRALRYAHHLVGTGHADSTHTTNHINQLTNHYLHNLTGHTPPTNTGAGTGTGTNSATGDVAAEVQRAIQVALAQHGKPYVFGAEGPNSFDCSGLMRYSTRQAGVNLPRVAADQYERLPKVHPGNIRPGDLIFPESRFENGRAKHVMMYIGSGQCIEASRPGVPVGVTSLPPSYRATRWT